MLDGSVANKLLTGLLDAIQSGWKPVNKGFQIKTNPSPTRRAARQSYQIAFRDIPTALLGTTRSATPSWARSKRLGAGQ
jgi:hypothetical protein